MTGIPIWEKYAMTVQEASEYFSIGEKKIRRIVSENINADFVAMNGSKVLIKRKLFEQYLDEATVI